MGATSSSTAPYGAQIAQVNTDMPCYREGPIASLNGYGAQNITASITAPLGGGPGQSVYYSDLVGSISLPDYLRKVGADASATHYKIDYTVTFDTTDEPNSQALSQSAFAVTGSVYKPLSDPEAPIPADGGVYPRLGPVRLGAAGSVTDFRLANLTYTIAFAVQNGGDTAFGSQFSVTCGRTPLFGNTHPRYIMASTAVDTAAVDTALLSPSNGVRGAFPPTGFREKSISANLNLDCSRSTTNRDAPYRFVMTGTGPSISSSGSQFNIKNWKHTFLLPGPVFYPLMTTGLHGFTIATDTAPDGSDAAGPGINLRLTNASPAQIDVSREFTASNPDTAKPLFSGLWHNVESGKYPNLTFTFPWQGDMALRPITAGERYKVTGGSVENFQGKLSIWSYENNFAPGGNELAVNCAVKPNALFRTGLVW